MARIGPSLLIASLVVSLAGFAGCLGSDAKDTNEVVDPDGGTLLNPELSGEALQQEVKRTLDIDAASEVAAPTWTVGEYWTVDVVFSEAIGGGEFTTTVVVAAEDATSYTVLTDNRDAAVFDAMFDLPFMGAFDKATLDTTFSNVPFQYYDWPLVGGKSWVAAFDPTFEGTPEDHTFHAAFMEAIPTPAGELPGYDIHGIDAEGFVRYQYDYVPALHWFNHVYWFNEEFPSDLSHADVHLMVTDHGFNWAGDLVRFTGELAIEKGWGLCPACPLQEEPAPATFQEAPTDAPVADFTVAEGVTDLAGFYFIGACDGASIMQLTAPSGQKFESRKTGLPPPEPPPADFPVPIGCEEEFGFIGVPAEPGTWNVRIVGGGAIFGGGFMLLNALTEEIVSLTVAPAE